MTYGKLILICATVLFFGLEQCAGPLSREQIGQEIKLLQIRSELLRLEMILKLKTPVPVEKPSIEIAPGTHKFESASSKVGGGTEDG